MTNKSADDDGYDKDMHLQNQVQQWYTIAMYELKVDPSMIAAIGKRVEELKKE